MVRSPIRIGRRLTAQIALGVGSCAMLATPLFVTAADRDVLGTPIDWAAGDDLAGDDRLDFDRPLGDPVLGQTVLGTPFPADGPAATTDGDRGQVGTVRGTPYFPTLADGDDSAERDAARDADPVFGSPLRFGATFGPTRVAGTPLPSPSLVDDSTAAGSQPPPAPPLDAWPGESLGSSRPTPAATPTLRHAPSRRVVAAADAAVSLEELLAAEAAFLGQTLQEPTVARELDPGWWQPLVAQPLAADRAPVSLSLDDVIVRAVHHSKQIQVFADLPLIRETAIVEADAAFDWQAFVESRWDDTSDPVGNSLTAGAGIDRFRDHHLTAQGGARKRTLSGGQLLAAQQFGIQENNSEFFVPNNQGTARLTLSFTQPLLRGRGRAYNSSLVCLAQLDKTVADDEFRRQLQTHLLEVTRAYWALYFERGVLLQKMNVYRRARTTVARLEARKRIDASESQIRSAQAALKARGAELIRARVAVKNAGSKLRSLINDPALGTSETTELMPIDRPQFATFPAPMGGSLQEAIQSRPEVHQAIKQIRAAGMRLSMSRNELMPLLNVVTEAYVAGLEDDRSIGDAWTKQFSVGEPGYAVGMQFEVPIGNRAARTRHIRRCHELRQMQNQYALTLSTIELEVRTSVREVNASQRELAAKEEAMQARVDQMDYIEQRWQRLPSQGTSAVLTLENLLLAQERVAAAEYDYLEAQMTYNLSLMNLKRSTGSLLQHEHVHIARGTVNGLPTHFIDR